MEKDTRMNLSLLTTMRGRCGELRETQFLNSVAPGRVVSKLPGVVKEPGSSEEREWSYFKNSKNSSL